MRAGLFCTYENPGRDYRSAYAEQMKLVEALGFDEAWVAEHHFNPDASSPTFIATSTADAVKLAAEQGYGVMAGPPFPLASVRETLRLYRETAPQSDPRLVLIRFYHLGRTHAQAVEEASVLLRPFVERMQVATARMQPEWTAWMELDRMIEDSLIGTATEVREKALRIESELRPHSLILKPICPDIAKRRADLEAFGETILARLGLPPEAALAPRASGVLSVN